MFRGGDTQDSLRRPGVSTHFNYTRHGDSKVAHETVGRLYFGRRGFPVDLTRTFNHCGPGQGPGFVFSDMRIGGVMCTRLESVLAIDLIAAIYEQACKLILSGQRRQIGEMNPTLLTVAKPGNPKCAE